MTPFIPLDVLKHIVIEFCKPKWEILSETNDTDDIKKIIFISILLVVIYLQILISSCIITYESNPEGLLVLSYNLAKVEMVYIKLVLYN